MSQFANSKSSRKRKERDFQIPVGSGQIQEKRMKRDNFCFLPVERYQNKECGGRGNCFFLVISHLLGPNANYNHKKLRKDTCDYIEKYLLEDHCGFIYDQHPKEHINKMRKSGTWATHVEIRAISNMLKRTIHIYEPKFSMYDGVEKLVGYTKKLLKEENILQMILYFSDMYQKPITKQLSL